MASKLENKLSIIGVNFEKINDWAIKIYDNTGYIAIGNTELDMVTSFKYSYINNMHDFVAGYISETGTVELYIRGSRDNQLIKGENYSLTRTEVLTLDGTACCTSDMILIQNRTRLNYMVMSKTGQKTEFYFINKRTGRRDTVHVIGQTLGLSELQVNVSMTQHMQLHPIAVFRNGKIVTRFRHKDLKLIQNN